MIHINSLRHLGDVQGYKNALREVAEKHAGPEFSLMLLDLHLMEKDYDEASLCIDDILTVVGRDAALLSMRALMRKLAGDLDGAKVNLSEAKSLEANCSYVYLMGLPVLVSLKDNAGIRDTFMAMEKSGMLKAKDVLAADPQFAEFLKSPESAQWR